MVVVDTSVWVSTLRSTRAPEIPELNALLDHDLVALVAPVRIEILAGAKAQDLPKLRRTFSALPLWLPQDSTWQLVESWLPTAAKKGQRFGVADLLIAGIAKEHDAQVWSLDGDFNRLAQLGFVGLFEPNGDRGDGHR